MGPAKLKHILSQYGETGRVYLARDPKGEVHQEPARTAPRHDADTRKQSKNKQRHQSYRFVEGWIEFEDKKVARHVADLLNAKTIGARSPRSKCRCRPKATAGGKPSSPFYHDIWTLKYLPKFKWNLLSAGLAQQHAREAALFRNEISQSKKAQSQYLGQVERGRVHQKIKEKRAAAAGAKEGVASEDADSRQAEVAVPSASSKPPKKARAFEQRQTIQKQRPNPGKPDAALQGVLDSLF
jgi:ESF2/ABP1 family protein